MATFVLHSETDPLSDMIFCNPNVPEAPTGAQEYAEAFTDVLHEEGHAGDRLIPLADLAIGSAANSND